MAISAEDKNFLVSLYVGYFNRAPDPAGLQFWIDQVEAGRDTNTIAADFAASPEAKSLYPFLTTPDVSSPTSFITAVYANLFNRAPDAAGQAFWEAALSSGSVSPADAIDAIIKGATTAPDSTILSNKITVGLDFASDAGNASGFTFDVAAEAAAKAAIAGVTEDDASVTAALAATDAFISGAANIGQTLTLTEGQDNILGTSGNDTILALVDGSNDTLTLGDTIDGVGGDDTLKVAYDDNANLSLSGKTFNGVENLVIDYARNDGAADINLANKAFDTVTVDFDGTAQDLSNVDLSNVDASSAVSVRNVSGDGDHDVDVNFTSSNASSGSTSVNYSDLDVNEFYSVIDAAFSSASAHEFNLAVSDVDSNDNFNVNANIDLDAADVELAVNIDIDSVTGEDVNFYLDFNTNGVTADATVNITDSNTNEFDLNIDNNGNGTSDEDSLTLNLSSVNTDGDQNETLDFEADHFETINVNVSGNGAVFGDIDIDDNDGNDLTLNIVAGADLLVDGDININSNVGSTTINVSGTGDVDLGDVDMYRDGNDNTVMTVNAADLTGNLTLEDSNGNGNVASIDVITAGVGNDTITLGGYTTVVETGAGDDFVDLNGVDYGDAEAETIDGGAGVDTVAINDGSLLDAATAANINNFEVLDIRAGTGSYDMSVEDSLTSISLTNTALSGNVSIVNAAATATLEFAVSGTSDVNLTGANDLSFALADDSGSSDELAIALSANDTDTDQTADAEVTAALSANGIETIRIASTATTASEESAAGANDALTSVDYTNNFTLYADDATDIVLSGDAVLNLTIGADDANANSIVNTAVDFVDASASTAGVTVDLSAIDTDANAAGEDVAVNTAAVTFKGSDADDTYTASHNGDIIQGNGGADTINLSANGTLTAATDASETVRYAAVADSQLTLTDTDDDGDADTATGFDVINEFGTAGVDIIELSAALGLATGDARADIIQKGSFTSGVANLEDFIGDGADFFDTGLVDRAVAFATDGTDGYLFIDANSDGDFTQEDDMFVELSGVTSLAVTDISFG